MRGPGKYVANYDVVKPKAQVINLIIFDIIDYFYY
jgi:hypothetical protein